MPTDGDWRSQSAYDYVEELTTSEMAWEFLRRNPDYMREFLDLSSSGQIDGELGREFALRWGLCFRGRPPEQRA